MTAFARVGMGSWPEAALFPLFRILEVSFVYVLLSDWIGFGSLGRFCLGEQGGELTSAHWFSLFHNFLKSASFLFFFLIEFGYDGGLCLGEQGGEQAQTTFAPLFSTSILLLS